MEMRLASNSPMERMRSPLLTEDPADKYVLWVHICPITKGTPEKRLLEIPFLIEPVSFRKCLRDTSGFISSDIGYTSTLLQGGRFRLL